MKGKQCSLLRPPPTSAQRALAPCWVVIAVTVAVTLWFCSLCAMERSRSGACITTRDAKHSASYRAHTCGLRGTGNGRLASPVGLGSHVGCPSLERSRTAPPDPPLLPFPLVISHLTGPPRTGLWGRDGPLPVTSPPSWGTLQLPAKLTWAFHLRKRGVQLMPPICIQHVHACTARVACPVPMPATLSNGARRRYFSRTQSLQIKLIL